LIGSDKTVIDAVLEDKSQSTLLLKEYCNRYLGAKDRRTGISLGLAGVGLEVEGGVETATFGYEYDC
jgi:hypothetical protein